MPTISRPSSIQTGSQPSTSCRGGPPAVGTTQTWSPSTYATVDPSGESRGSVSSQYGIGSRPLRRRDRLEPPAVGRLGTRQRLDRDPAGLVLADPEVSHARVPPPRP